MRFSHLAMLFAANLAIAAPSASKTVQERVSSYDSLAVVPV